MSEGYYGEGKRRAEAGEHWSDSKMTQEEFAKAGPKEVEMTNVNDRFGALSGRLSYAETLANQLLSRLEPVMTPEPFDVDASTAPRKVQSPIAHSIDDLASRVELVNSVLNYIHDHLEI